MSVADLIRRGHPAPCRPWPRFVLAAPEWRAMAAVLAGEAAVDLLAMWADTHCVHALLHDRVSGAMLPVSVPTESGFYPTLSRARPAAAWFERMIRDLWGHHAEDGRDGRPWLDHGAWALHAPLSARPVAVAGQPEPAEFFPPAGAQTQIPLGPVLSGIGEPAHMKLTVAGKRVARLEARLGYAHKGTLSLMRGKSPRVAARFAARLAGDATVAQSIAFAGAAEEASGVTAPPRATALRCAMADLERIGSHLLDAAAIAELAGLAGTAATLARLRETVARTAGAAFGHRLMMDCVVPGGVAGDIAPDGADAIRAAAAQVGTALPNVRARFAMMERLSGLGPLPPAFAAALAVGGRTKGDAAARIAVQLTEIGRNAAALADVLPALPAGPLRVELPPVGGEGFGRAAGARGDVWHWLRLEGGQIMAAFARDPGWLLWPALEAAAPGTSVADVPLLIASFGVTVSGMDL
jgi:Ni,Fe-hydrogenase III large subunit